MIRNRKNLKKYPIHAANLLNLASIPRQPVVKIGTDKTANTLKLALLNIRSLAGKSFLINDFIINHNLDLMFLTETWLNDENSAVV